MRALLLLLLALPAAAQETVALRGRVFLGEQVVEDGVVVLSDGSVSAVGTWGAVVVPDGARLVAPDGAWVTPGLIDAAASVDLVAVDGGAEQAAEVVPHLRVLDRADLSHPAWGRLARRGVTTVFLTDSPESVVGARGAVVRTAGPREARVVDAAGAVKVTLGPETWRRGGRNRGTWGGIDHFVRRPTTRMGSAWVLREAFSLAARRRLEGPAGDVLRRVIAGEVPLRMQARTRGDLEASLRVAAEFQVQRPVLIEEATEARHLLGLLKRTRATVLFGPIFDRPRGWRAGTGEAEDPALGTPGLLLEAGVPFCLTAADRTGEDDLVGQLALAVRYGLAPETALAAVTTWPARVLNLDAATIAGDLVLWDGPPWEPTSNAVAVWIGGRLVSGGLPAAPQPPRGRAF